MTFGWLAPAVEFSPSSRKLLKFQSVCISSGCCQLILSLSIGILVCLKLWIPYFDWFGSLAHNVESCAQVPLVFQFYIPFRLPILAPGQISGDSVSFTRFALVPPLFWPPSTGLLLSLLSTSPISFEQLAPVHQLSIPVRRICFSF